MVRVTIPGLPSINRSRSQKIHWALVQKWTFRTWWFAEHNLVSGVIFPTKMEEVKP